MLDNYCKSVMIEANTMEDMARTLILPAVGAFAADTAKDVSEKKAVCPALAFAGETKLVERLTVLIDAIAEKTEALHDVLSSLEGVEDVVERSAMIRDGLLPAMEALRAPCDKAEQLTAKSYWPYPTYADLLFGVK